MGFIYKATYRVSGKAYIGQTIRPILERLEEHQKTSSGCRAFYAAIKKHGWENFDVEWYEVPDDELNFYEEMLVALLGTLAPGGYNLMEGGGAIGKRSEETKQKMSEARTGKTHTEETKQKMSKAHIGKTLREETKQKMSKAHIGKTLREETKQKMSESTSGEKHPMYGKTLREETKQKISKAMTGKTGEKHPMYGKTLTDKTKQKISEMMSGEKHHMYGKTHTEETKQKMSEAQSGKKNHASKKVYRYKLDGTYIDSFESSGEAARAIDKKDGNLISSCACGKGKHKTAYGFKWSRVPPVSAEHLISDFDYM
ncbi:GIY-YIG catalytic domain-containing endonuclease [Paramecium bursaria Chlorella virus CVM-1]|nr:GIY-YIG catalytic domain-containing endonuclease [Paramecium bursaria Chlorella virus CVM-1]